jgi:hypothetical protein
MQASRDAGINIFTNQTKRARIETTGATVDRTAAIDIGLYLALHMPFAARRFSPYEVRFVPFWLDPCCLVNSHARRFSPRGAREEGIVDAGSGS